MSIKRISTQRVGGNPTVYIGRPGDIFYNPDVTGPLRISDGVTPGGIDLVSGTGGPGSVIEADLIGNVTLPPGGDILDSIGNSVIPSDISDLTDTTNLLAQGATLTDDKEVKVTVGNTEYWAIVNRANNNDNGVEASAVDYDSDDNMIMLTISDGGVNEGERLIISKFDSSANLLWQKQIEQDLDINVAHDLIIDSDDNIIVSASMDNGDAVDSIVIMKFTAAGSLVWQKDYQSSVITENIESVSVNVTIGSETFEGDPVQSVLVYGQVVLLAAGWIFQSSEDDTNWTTLGTVLGSSYDVGTGETLVFFADATFGGNLNGDLSYRLVGDAVNTWQEVGGIVLSGNNIFLGGQYEDNNNGSGYNGLLMKVSATDGTLAWSKIFDYSADTRVWGIDVGADGNPVVVGLVDGQGLGGAFVAKFNGSTGAHTWTKILFDVTENKNYSGADLVIDSQNNIYVSVNSSEDIVHEIGDNTQVTIGHVVKLNSSGTIQWMRRIGPGPCASVTTGLDCDDSGNVYLSALTVSQQNPTRDINDFLNNTRNVLAIAKYSTNGTVLWQRYIEADGYQFAASADDGTSPGSFNYTGQNRGRLLSLNNSGKIAVQVTAQHIDLDDFIVNSIYYESLTFQMDQDGREMTIGSGLEKFSIKESRFIPGKFIEIPELGGGPFTPAIVDLTEDVIVSNPALTIEEGILAQHIFKSAPYEYVFGNDGTLTIPNDGDIKLVQTQIGWFSIFGPANNITADVDIRCNVVDPSTGDVYVAGESDNYSQGWVARYNSQGQILWSVKLYDDNDNFNNRCNAIKLNPITGNVVVLCEYYGNQDSVLIVEIDPDTAKVVNSMGFRDQGEDSGAIAYDFDFFSNGDVAVVGRKYDEYNSISVVPQTGSGVSELVILNSATASNPVHPVTTSWYVSGTEITGRAGITHVNLYSDITGTVRQGSGATFEIVIDETGAIFDQSHIAAGTNYRVGHKILLDGAPWEGPDIIVTVTSLVGDGTTGAISGISTEFATVGTGIAGTYTALTGTNYQVASGFSLDFVYNDTYSGGGHINSIVGGSNYVVGDVITVLGTSLGGSAPANNMTVTVDSVDGGAVTGYTASGTAQTTYRKLTIAGAVDFGGTGTWSVVHELGGEAFVVRYGEGIEWSKVLSAGGQYDTERYLSVAIDSNDNIYAAGEMYSIDNAAGADLNEYWCAVVSKFNSSGTHQWSKALNATLVSSYAKGVAVRGSTLVVSHNNDNNQAIVTKLDTSGNVKWQRETYTAGGDSSVAIDSNGDIYAAIESNIENRYEDVINIIRFATNGEVIYRKFVGTLIQQFDNSDERFKNGRNLTIDTDHVYISGYTSAFASSQNNGFLVKLPKAGDCDGSYGVWSVQSDTYDVDRITSTEATTFTPLIGTGNWETWVPAFLTNWVDLSGDSYYQTFQEIRDRDGGAIEFADGTRQTSSAQQIPQLKISNGADHRLTVEDMGKHIYVTDSDTTINIPYPNDNPLPIGFTVVIVNYSGGVVSIDADGGNITVVVPGLGSGQYWDLDNEGMATLLKVEEYTWFLTGNVTDDN